MKYRYNKLTDEVVPVQRLDSRSTADWKPLHCENMGFDGSLEDAQAIDRSLGAPEVSYDEHMRPVFNDKSTYVRYLKAHGKVNKTSGRGHHTLTPCELERAIKRAKES